MIYGQDYIVNRVKEGTHGRIDIFPKHIDTHQGATIFLTIREENPERAVSRMEDFCKSAQGDFTVYLRRYAGQSWNSAEVVHIHISRELAKITPVNGTGFSQADIELIVNERLEKARREQMAADELQRLKDENARLTQPMERIMFILEGVVSKFIPSQEPAPIMNGTSATNDDQLNNALAGLIQKFSAPGIVKLNAYLEKNPAMITMVKEHCKL